jgi:predicted HicB family RNase H-like nuclease
MNNTMRYKGYPARIEFDRRDDIFVGKVLAVVDSIAFHGTTVDELKKNFQMAIDHYLADRAARPTSFPT